MNLRKYVCWLAGLAALGFASGTAFAAKDSYITVAIDKGTAPGLVIGFRTSDVSASFLTCTITGNSQTCSKYNSNSSIPKNLGNILCLPAANAKFTVSPRCQSLLNAGSGSCQTNSSSGKCPSGTTAIMPACNYRTSSNSSNTANWVWNLGIETGVYSVDCLQAGYQGPTPK